MVLIKTEKNLPIPPSSASPLSPNGGTSGPSTFRLEEEEAPPDYEKAASASLVVSNPTPTATSDGGSPIRSAPSIMSLPNKTRATNFIHISNPVTAIQGSWTIDTSITMPESLLPKLSKSKTRRPNLQIKTTVGSIDAIIDLVGEHDRASLRLGSGTGTVQCTVRKEEEQKIDLKVTSGVGAITIYIPRSFSGFFTLGGKLGNHRFSSAVGEHLTRMNQIKGKRMHFLSPGGHDGSVFEQYDYWPGDLLFAESSMGNICIFYEDERGPTRSDSMSSTVTTPLSETSEQSATTVQ